MIIEPNSTIKLYRDVPMDNTYQNTIYFSSLTDQNNYFHNNASILRKTFSNVSYQRVNRDVMRLEVKADDIYDCNYLAFQNTSYGSRWFYAFITGVEYVSNTVSEISFEIDVIQTWFFDVDILPSMVEREHSTTDVVGEHLQAEPLTDLLYIRTVNSYLDLMSGGYHYAIICTDDPYVYDGQQFPYGTTVNGGLNDVISGVTICYKLTNLDQIYKIIRAFETSDHVTTDDIIGVYQYPAVFERQDGDEHYKTFGTSILKPDNLDGHTPRNKKLLTFPYCYLNVGMATGQSQDYRYEYFNNTDTPNRCYFTGASVIYPSAQFMLCPQDYNHGEARGRSNWEYSLSMNCSASVGFTGNTFAQWQVSNKYLDTQMALQMVGSLGNVGFDTIGAVANVGEGKGSILGETNKLMRSTVNAQLGMGNAILQNRATHLQADKKANSPIGSIGSDMCNFAIGNLGVNMNKICIRKEIAEAFDCFFDKYGYATNTLKVPNRSSRPHWNYVKTVGCNVRGGAPANDLAKIVSIYDSGITFWRHGNEVGNYNLNNSPA